jgi:hypothetical protein
MAEKKTKADVEEFDLEDWLDEGMQGLRRTLKGKRPQILPEQFKKHTRAARKEMLLAVRSLLDTAIEELEGESQAPEKAANTEVK